MRMALWSVAVVTIGCGGGSGGAPDAAPASARVAVVSNVDTRALDVLFVIDDSSGMDAHQAALGAAFGELVAGLTSLDGALPDLHVGVVSSSAGVGADTI